MGKEETEKKSDHQGTDKTQHVILFYKYHPLSNVRDVTEIYRSALETLCERLDLSGRILVGCNDHQSEGINGTLAGNLENVLAFTYALNSNEEMCNSSIHQKDIIEFWTNCKKFYERANCKPLIMTPEEFKWSAEENPKGPLFPDLHIKLVSELIGTGGTLASISLNEVHQGYLTPSEWHERLSKLKKKQTGDGHDENDTVLIDCRNTKEWQIGHFSGASDPHTTTFNQFPVWVKQHSKSLADKNILMYCTGGIRCEKASAFIRREIPSAKEVRHLKGGIHKYLDEFGERDDCLFKGKNFVFDGRGAIATKKKKKQSDDVETAEGDDLDNTVGTCTYCNAPYDVFDPQIVCTVCREPTLVCPSCKDEYLEYHCHLHKYLMTCYFTNLESFSQQELERQLIELEDLKKDIAVGKKFKKKRKTLTKQCDKIKQRLSELGVDMDIDQNNGFTAAAAAPDSTTNESNGESGCSGLKRKRILDGNNTQQPTIEPAIQGNSSSNNNNDNKKIAKKKGNNIHLQEKKQLERQHAIQELVELGLAAPPSSGRDPVTGIRVPESCTRILQTKTKGKWCGRTLLDVVQSEFVELSNSSMLIKILERRLLRVNGVAVKSIDEADTLRLKNMDVISRIVRWYEPPVHLPSGKIHVEKVKLPKTILQSKSSNGQKSDTEEDAVVYVCDKPCTVPVHHAGPYLSNTLTMMVESQEGLEPKSLIPCHRIDRVTSGMTLCCTDIQVARLIQGRIDAGCVQKQYLARVHGHFPAAPNGYRTIKNMTCNDDEDGIKPLSSLPTNTDLAQWRWVECNNGRHDDDEVGNKDDKKSSSSSTMMLQVNAPIDTTDPANGIRQITTNGKSSQSLFTIISYHPSDDTSIILCSPQTGRSHQLRVHLQWLGYPIVHDIQYNNNNRSVRGDMGEGQTRIPSNVVNRFVGIQRLKEAVVASQHEEEVDVQNSPYNVRNNITPKDISNAKQVCSCYNFFTSSKENNDDDDVNDVNDASSTVMDSTTTAASEKSGFTPAQLLQGGHEICLHAYRYRMHFLDNSKNTSKADKRGQNQQDEAGNGEGIIEKKRQDASSSTAAPNDGKRKLSMEFQVGLPTWAKAMAKDGKDSTESDIHADTEAMGLAGGDATTNTNSSTTDIDGTSKQKYIEYVSSLTNLPWPPPQHSISSTTKKN